MNSSRVSPSFVLVACAASLALTLTACGSDSDTSASSSASSSPSSLEVYAPTLTETATENSTCPTAAPAEGVASEWTLPGTTGSVDVAGSTETNSPLVKVSAPFSVTETQVRTLKAGDGPVVSPTATVSVCYMGVNGRDGSVFDSSYEQGAPVEFPLANVVPGFQKAIAGQKVGSTVGVAMASADGYPEGQPAAGIEKGDSLVFAIKILEVTG